RSDPGELCAECANPGDAQPAPHAQAIGSRAGEPRAARAKDPRGRQHQIGLGAYRRHGKSGRAMLEALIAGETNPAKLASLADRRVKASAETLREALRGRVTKHHRFLLRLHLNQIDALDAAMATIDAQVEANLGPFRTAVELIMSIPGIKNLSAQVIVSEIGIDMSRFPSAAHLISWACICPRNDESAGKRRSNRQRKGPTWLKTTVAQCGWAAVKKKGSYLQAQFQRIKARRGPKKAIMAVVASILTAIYHMLKDGTMYRDLGCDHFKRHSTDQQKKRLVKRLAGLGYPVELKPLPACAVLVQRRGGAVCGRVGASTFPPSKKSAWSNAWQALAMLWNSSHFPPEPCLWHGQQEEFVARSEQVSFLLGLERSPNRKLTT